MFALDDDVSDEVIQKLIHGCKANEETTSTISGVGLGYFATNKLRLHGLYQFFDSQPSVLIVPILTVDQVSSWDGDGYEALFMTGTKKGESTIEAVASGTRLHKHRPHANEGEFEAAGLLLKDALLFLMESLWKEPPKCLSERHMALLSKFQNDSSKQVKVPAERNALEKQPVRKILLGLTIQPVLAPTNCIQHPTHFSWW